MSRTTDLLSAAAYALDDGSDPLGDYFLVRHNVTDKECLDLATNLAMGARLLAWVIEHPETAAAMVDAARLASPRGLLGASVRRSYEPSEGAWHADD